MKLKFYLILTFIFIFGLTKTNAQNCFEIESILVDACGSPEGANEMARFHVGLTTLNVNDLTITWPNNSFKNICQDANTALKVDSLNQTIQGCGYLIEPSNGDLPAGSNVIIVTSTDMSVTSNSFASLNDTLIILFQCSGNTSGHFANNNPLPGLRTLIMSFSSPSNCVDSVTYDRSLLVNQAGTYGGPSAFNDGAYVSFDASGNPTYLNNGCQALVNAMVVNGGPDLIYCNNPLNLNGTISGNSNSIQWTSASGTFNNPNNLTTQFTPQVGLTGNIYAVVAANGNCNVTSTDSVKIYMPVVGPQPILTVVDSNFACSLLSFNYTYSWTYNGTPLVGPAGPFLTSSLPGCYEVTVSDVNGCSVFSDTVCIAAVGLNEHDANGVNVSVSQTTSSINLNMNATNALGNFELTVYNAAGQIISQQGFTNVSDKFETSVNSMQWQQGVYYVNVQGEKFLKNLQVVVVK